MNDQSKKLEWINVVVLLAFLAKITVNYLSNALPINGFTPGQLSDLYPNQFVPSGFTFSIWGVIYLFCLLFVVEVFRKPIHANIKSWFILICGINISWLFAWHYQLVGVSLLVMISFFLVLLNWYLMIRKDESSKDLFIVKAISSLYLGWISVALAANVTTFMVYHNILIGEAESESLITFALCMIILLIALFMTLRFKDFIYPLVIAWAAYGIYAKRLVVDNINDQWATIGSMILATAALCFSLFALWKQYMMKSKK